MPEGHNEGQKVPPKSTQTKKTIVAQCNEWRTTREYKQSCLSDIAPRDDAFVRCCCQLITMDF